MVLTILCGVLALGAVALLILLFAEKKRSGGLAIELARAGNSDDLRARALEQANIVAVPSQVVGKSRSVEPSNRRTSARPSVGSATR